MSYQVLARKWRPRSFAEMVGQSHVLRALINALDNDQLHHAFLFTGTRGVGKTTVARILAKSLNCEQGVSSTPCGECNSCREIDEGRFVDLIEVDAASRTKVEDTRDLLENVQYAPSRGRYKVYLIDEVHMLSKHSFNALLKTLEEPPPHVKFLLATTDPQRLPITILSRCLQFNLKHLSVEMIQEHLQKLMEAEDISAESDAISQIAMAADGSMRDGLSLLDQSIAYGNGKVVATDVREMLGSIDRDRIIALLQALASTDAERLMMEVRGLQEFSPDYGDALGELTSVLHHVALAQLVPGALDSHYQNKEAVLQLARDMTAEDVQLYYQIGVVGRRDLPLAPEARTGFEMVLLRMLAFRPAAASSMTPVVPASKTVAGESVKPAMVKAEESPGTAASSKPELMDKPVHEAASVQEAAPGQEAPPTLTPVSATENIPVAPALAESSSKTVQTDDWIGLIKILPLVGITRQLAENCALLACDDNHYRLSLDPVHAHLNNDGRRDSLSKALEGYLGNPVNVDIVMAADKAAATPAAIQKAEKEARQQAAEDAVSSDNQVTNILEHFAGEIQPGSIRPLDN